jgi:hypothetical protein
VRFEPLADDGALRALEDLPADPEDHPSDKHQPEEVLESTECEHELPEYAEHAGEYEDHSGSDAVDECPSEEGDDDVGEGVDCVEEVEGGLSEGFVVSVFVVVFDELFECLRGRGGTLGLSKAYS